MAIKVVIRFKQGWWSRSHNSEKLSQSLPTTSPGCRDRQVPSHTRSHSRISEVQGRACHTDSAAHARARAREFLNMGARLGGRGDRGRLQMSPLIAPHHKPVACSDRTHLDQDPKGLWPVVQENST